MTWRNLAGSTALGIVLACAAAGGAQAGLVITDNGAPQQMIDDAGGNPAGQGLPLGLTGFDSSNPQAIPTLNIVDPGLYTFTFVGSGDATQTNTFSLGGHTFTTGVTAFGTSFSLVLGAGIVNFTYVADLTSINHPSPVTLADGGSADGATYFLALDNSSHCNNVNPAPGNGFSCDGVSAPQTSLSDLAWIGLSDKTFSGASDHDFQDLGVMVQEVPEPATLALFGAGLAGLGVMRRRRRAA